MNISSTYKSVSKFLVNVSLRKNCEILADRKLLTLSDEKWLQFQQMLDSAPKEHPNLNKLLNQPGVFD